MSPTKRKLIASDASDDDDSFKHRRSSLRVNLSYSVNLSDSGNGSLGRTQIENDERGINVPQANVNRKLSRNKFGFASNNAASNNDSEVPPQTKKGIQLKRLTINLEDINAKEQAFDTDCKRLKDAILSKTKEIFDKQDELSVKTAMVLGDEADCSASDTNSGDRQREGQYSNIVSTPTNGGRHSSAEKAVNILTPKRLFLENDKQKCRIIEDVILDKDFSIARETNQDDSPILSGSNRRLQFLRTRAKLFSQSRFENCNNMHSTVCSDRSINAELPIVCSTFIEDNAIVEKGNKNLCYREDDNINASQAMRTTNKVMSMEITEIQGGIQSSKKHISLQNRNTDICNSVKTTKKEKYKDKNLEQNESVMLIQSVQNIDSPLNRLPVQDKNVHLNASCINDENNRDIANTCVGTIIPAQAISVKIVEPAARVCNAPQMQERSNQINEQREGHCILNISDSNSIRSSLNVNTSLNILTENGKIEDTQKSSKRRAIMVNQSLEATINNQRTETLKNKNESARTTRTSLHMNTSVDSMCKIQCRKSKRLNKQIKGKNNKDLTEDHLHMKNQYVPTIRGKETDNIDFLENISLIERLRNISGQDQACYKNKSNIFEIVSKEKTDEYNTIKHAKCQDNEHAMNNDSRNSYSYVEGTPYPISRSVLFKSQLKHKMQSLSNCPAHHNSINSANSKKNNDKTKSSVLHPALIADKTHMPTTMLKTIKNDTIILEDTLSCNRSNTQDKSIIIQDTLNETQLKINERDIADSQNADNIPERRGRRKLLPLNENSQLCSITPLKEDLSDVSKKSTSINKKRKLKKKPRNRKSVNYNNDMNNIECKVAKGQTCSDDDISISENKRKKDTKTRKPRKIISKKIVIKKFVNKDILNILEESGQNKKDKSMEDRNSLDDFVTNRIIPTQLNKYKPQKIVIVTTGLSNGDRNLVKSIVRSLGMAEMELNVSKRTTHVVSTGVRTVNLLHGIIRGCWLITLEWVLKSLEENMWLNPEKFEMKHFSKAVLENRKDRQLFGPSYVPELFTACGLIYVEDKTILPYDTLKELIKTAGGHITDKPKFAKITIGVNGLKETWVIDSITTGELQSPKLYQRK